MRNVHPGLAAALLACTPVAVSEDETPPEPRIDPPVGSSDGIPDRVSLEEGSPHYFPHWRHLGVRFNGGESTSCVEFCVSEGWMRSQLFHGGRPKTERGKFVTVTHRGKIEPYWRSKP